MKTFIKIAVILLVCLILNNCGPKDDTNPDVLKVPQETKDWGVFKVGTWWVFEEETSKLRDSIYVYKNEELIRPRILSPCCIDSYEEFIVHLTSNLKIDSFRIRVAGQNLSIKLINENKIFSEFPAECNILPAPPIVQGAWSRSGPPSQITTFDTIYPNLNIGNLSFTNVVRANNNMNLAYDWTPTLIYSAKHIGIVRKEFPEYKQVWNLVRYNIVQ
jgi:hypothetical protein